MENEKKAADEDAGAAALQEQMDEDTEKGFHGDAVDPTPNEAYTVAGVTSDTPTPETDPALAKEAREASGLDRSGIEQQAEREQRQAERSDQRTEQKAQRADLREQQKSKS